MSDKFTIRVEAFTPRRSNTLFGFCTVVIPELRLRINDIAVHEKNGRRWAQLPSKPMIDRDRNLKRDENGKIAYAIILQFTDRATADAFSAKLIEALLEHTPSAFDEEAAA
jgi:hypothetical protein